LFQQVECCFAGCSIASSDSESNPACQITSFVATHAVGHRHKPVSVRTTHDPRCARALAGVASNAADVKTQRRYVHLLHRLISRLQGGICESHLAWTVTQIPVSRWNSGMGPANRGNLMPAEKIAAAGCPQKLAAA